MNINYDIKISEFFSGEVHYEYHDYLDEVKIQYYLIFKNGKILCGYLMTEQHEIKDIAPEKWNDNFCIKVPKYANFDNGRWERKSISTSHDLVICSDPYGTVIADDDF